jgi:hypothetical protein
MSTQLRVTRLTAIAKASGAIDYLNRASFRLRFNKGEVDPRIQSGATTMGWLFDSQGTLRARPHNLIRNSVMQGAAAGTPGTTPTNWTQTVITAGLTRTVVGVGVIDGMNYIDIRVTGTTGDTNGYLLNFESLTAVNASQNQVWSSAFFASIVGGSLTGITAVTHAVNERSSAGGTVSSESTAIAVTSTLTRFTRQRTLLDANTAAITNGVGISIPSGSTVDITLRIAAPQLNLCELQPYYPTTGSAYFGPRLTYDPANLSSDPGLLAEDSRTNSIRNSTMQGSATGTPGTLPTNWLAPTSFSGLSREIVSVGVENGISYVDLRYFGTADASTPSVIAADGFNKVAAVSGQTWSHSMFLKVVGGTLNGIVLRHDMRVQSMFFFLQAIGLITSVIPTSAPLREQRTVSTGTITSEGAEFITGRLSMVPTAGATIDITLRIGLPQLELGASASSPIPTFGTALTRSADNLSMTDMSWYQQSGGVLYCEAQKFTSVGPVAVAQLDDGTINNTDRILIGVPAQGQSASYGFINVGGVTQSNFSISNNSNTFCKVVISFTSGYFRGSFNGAPGVPDNSGILPTVSNIRIGSNGGGNFNGLIREIAFIPDTSIPDSALQRMTR